MSKLPFLEQSHWPVSKEVEERVVNPSYDKQLQDSLVDELLIALEHKDHKGVTEVLHLLHESFENEEYDK